MEASIGHVSRAAMCHMPGSDLAATPRDQRRGRQVRKRWRKVTTFGSHHKREEAKRVGKAGRHFRRTGSGRRI